MSGADSISRVNRLLDGYDEIARSLNDGLARADAVGQILQVDGGRKKYESTDVQVVADELVEVFGTKEDDKLEKNPKLEAFVEGLGKVNYYTYISLVTLDPEMHIRSLRGNAKMLLLPMFQLLVPFGMAWYRLVQKDMWNNAGICCDDDSYIFRGVGFVTFLYSAWQIMDGAGDSSSKYLLEGAARHWSLTGLKKSRGEALQFYLCYASQTLCALLLLVVTYTIYNTSDTPLDLLMNCVAINFVLDIDSEWMNGSRQKRSREAARLLFKRWRDACGDELEVKKSIRNHKWSRRNVGAAGKLMCKYGNNLVVVLGYAIVVGWTFCPAKY